jgi:hypothetical protein
VSETVALPVVVARSFFEKVTHMFFTAKKAKKPAKTNHFSAAVDNPKPAL